MLIYLYWLIVFLDTCSPFKKWDGNIGNDRSYQPPWTSTLDKMIEISISEKSKEEAAREHKTASFLMDSRGSE